MRVRIKVEVDSRSDGAFLIAHLNQLLPFFHNQLEIEDQDWDEDLHIHYVRFSFNSDMPGEKYIELSAR